MAKCLPERAMTSTDPFRTQLAQFLDWHEAHATFDQAVADLPSRLRGKVPEGLPYSPWQLLEHLRRTQADILDFCLNPEYKALDWPDDYWPAAAEPPSSAAWAKSAAAFRRDRNALRRLATDPAIELTARIPHGDGQTYLREILLAADHAAYHVGELIVARRLLHAWPST